MSILLLLRMIQPMGPFFEGIVFWLDKSIVTKYKLKVESYTVINYHCL